MFDARDDSIYRELGVHQSFGKIPFRIEAYDIANIEGQNLGPNQAGSPFASDFAGNRSLPRALLP